MQLKSPLLYLLIVCLCCSCSFSSKINNPDSHNYSICNNFAELVIGKNFIYPQCQRITGPGFEKEKGFHGFFFYNCAPLDLLQFDPTGQYALDMKIKIEERHVTPTDTAEIGIIDLKNNNRWFKIGETTAWNWQQGCRLSWVPGTSNQIIWDARAEDGKSFVSKIYNTQTKQTRTLPWPVYTLSPDGKTALTHNFERMLHGGTNFVGIPDPYANIWAPSQIGIMKMDLTTGSTKMIVSVKDMVKQVYSNGLPSDTVGKNFYIFREGYNHSGNRFIVFLKEDKVDTSMDFKAKTYGFSMTPEGKNIRFLYHYPSHHYWINDSTLLDNVNYAETPASTPVRGYYIFKDDGSGKAKEMLWEAPNGHDSFHPNGDWVLTDTYIYEGYLYLYLFHLPTKKIVPLGKFEFYENGKRSSSHPRLYRIDLHPRFTSDGNKVCFDSNHENLGRQMYMIDIRHIIHSPPKNYQAN